MRPGLEPKGHQSGDDNCQGGDADTHGQEPVHAEGVEQLPSSACGDRKSRNHHDPDQSGRACSSTRINCFGQERQERRPTGAHPEADEQKPKYESAMPHE